MLRVVLAVIAAVLVVWARPTPTEACGVKVSVRAPGAKRVLVARRAAPTPRRTLVARRPIRVGPVTRDAASSGESRRAPIASATGDATASTPPAESTPATPPADEAATPATEAPDRVAMADTKAETTPAPEPEPEPRVAPSGRSTKFSEEVFFRSSSAEVNGIFRTRLIKRARWLQRHRGTRVMIEGHTSTTGAAVPNQILSEARARSVKEFLVDHGVDESRIETVGRGMDDPAYQPGNRAKNRRVVIKSRRR